MPENSPDVASSSQIDTGTNDGTVHHANYGFITLLDGVVGSLELSNGPSHHEGSSGGVRLGVLDNVQNGTFQVQSRSEYSAIGRQDDCCRINELRLLESFLYGSYGLPLGSQQRETCPSVTTTRAANAASFHASPFPK